MKPRLLVIDDEPDIVAMTAEFFSLRGFEVKTASDGQEGLETARHFLPQVVLLDLKMKKIHADEILPGLREMLPESRIIMVTGSDPEISNRKIDTRCLDLLLEKDVSLKDILKHIQSGA